MEVAEEDWRPLYRTERGRMVATGQEWAEVVYVPNVIAATSKGEPIRYIAIRELVKQGVLPGMEDSRGADNPTVCHCSMFWSDLPSEGNSDQP